MNALKVILTPEAEADTKRLEPALQTRMLDKLQWMGQNAELLRHRALRGAEGVLLAEPHEHRGSRG